MINILVLARSLCEEIRVCIPLVPQPCRSFDRLRKQCHLEREYDFVSMFDAGTQAALLVGDVIPRAIDIVGKGGPRLAEAFLGHISGSSYSGRTEIV